MVDINRVCHPSEIYAEVVAEIIDRNGKPPEFAIRFLPSLNKTVWGFKRKKLVTIGARPSQGKSNMLLQLAYDFASQDKQVLFFSLEMTNYECIQRLIANYCDIDNFELITGRIAEDYTERYAVRINAFNEQLEKTKLILLESIGKTFDELFETIEKFPKADCVVIDYIQNIKGGKFQDNKSAIDEYILKLREYAIKRNFLAVIGSQINRGTYDNSKITPPEMHHLKGSGNIEECSDQVLLLHWNYWYSHDQEEKDNYWVRVAKNRDGRTGIFDCRIEPSRNRIYEGEEDGRTIEMGEGKGRSGGFVKAEIQRADLD